MVDRSLLSLRVVAALLAALALCASAASSSKGPRVRKELRSLTDKEYSLLVQGLSTMFSVPTAVGQKMFGPRYKEYNHFVVKHAVATQDPRGDQGHNGPAFMTFHRAFLLELEQSLLSVVPDLKALPYLDITMDVKGGKYYKTQMSVFSDKYAGSIDCSSGTGQACQVKDGVFAWRQIPTFNHQYYGKYASIYNGSQTTGLLRGPSNKNANKFVTRFPIKNTAVTTVGLKSFAAVSTFWLNPTNGISSGLSWAFTKADYERCFSASSYASWMEWNYCMDFTTYALSQNNSAYLDRFTSSMSTALHAGVHFIVGGLSVDGIDGDMKDVTTSPNEPLLFPLHHAFVDRSAMMWQRNALALNADMGKALVMWRFPASAADYPYTYSGTYLNDVVTSSFPFTDLFDGITKNLTHFDILNMTRPGNAIYTYSGM